MHDLVEAHSQFIIATHSPLLLFFPDATIYSFEPDGIRKVTYEETEQYQVTRRFLQDHRSMLGQLLRPGQEAPWMKHGS